MLVDCKDNGEHIRRPDWRRANYEGMKLELELINWQQALAAITVNGAWLRFKKIVEDLTERYVPVTTFRSKFKPKWLTKEVVKLLKQKKNAWRTARLYRNKETLARYEQLERDVKTKIRKAKRNMEKELSKSTDKNGKKFRNYISRRQK